jgi:hypothetical protein
LTYQRVKIIFETCKELKYHFIEYEDSIYYHCIKAENCELLEILVTLEKKITPTLEEYLEIFKKEVNNFMWSEEEEESMELDTYYL